MEKEYRVLSFSEGRELGIYELYSCLVGPDEFECILTEIEDRTWGRDLRPVVNRLKEQHARIAELEAQLAAAQERERWIPASEAPPKNGPYLILFKGKVVYATFLTNGWYQWYYANRVVPDAWRELPAPPEEAADANN
jgi:hypothetical protein